MLKKTISIRTIWFTVHMKSGKVVSKQDQLQHHSHSKARSIKQTTVNWAIVISKVGVLSKPNILPWEGDEYFLEQHIKYHVHLSPFNESYSVLRSMLFSKIAWRKKPTLIPLKTMGHVIQLYNVLSFWPINSHGVMAKQTRTKKMEIMYLPSWPLLIWSISCVICSISSLSTRFSSRRCLTSVD